MEKISGDFTLHINNSNFKHYIYENIHFFEHETNKEILSLKISAQKDSIYSIKYYEYTKSINQHLFYIGGNYLLKIQNDELGISIHGMAGVKHYVNVYEEVIVNFLPIDCTVDILYGDINTYQFPELKDTIIYQNIPLKLLPFYKLKVKTEKEKNSCMIYVSSYFLNESLIVDEKSFILAENVPKIVIFNNYVNKTKYSYFTLVKNEDIKINFALLNKGEYEIIFFINKLDIGKKNNIEKSTLITLKPKVWKDICNDVKQACEISFDILTKNFNIESALNITVNQFGGENEDYSDAESEGNKNGGGSNTALIAVITTISVILIIGVALFLILKFRKKGEIKEEIEKIPQNKESQLL